MPLISTYEDIVVSGIAGRFPESDSVDEFASNLYSGTDMVTEDDRRWPIGFFGLPRRNAKVKEINKFDREFFGISEADIKTMDPQMRIGCELTYEAIWDSGVDPNTLSDTNTGVYIGICYNEVALAQGANPMEAVGYIQLLFGRIAQIFNFKGPTVAIDTACASGLTVFHEAVTAMRRKLCDRAVVLGINIAMSPLSQYQFWILNMMAPDGKCKCLDKDADGYAKGEACVAMLLQNKSEAKRGYVTVVHTKSNADGFKELGITFPSTRLQERLMRETYAEAGVDPLEVKYVEAHCTGTQAGDPVEMEAIEGAMCTGRTEPLLIGAVKSNTGHTEGSSGLTSLTKVIIALENECIPPNLHLNSLNPDIPGLMSGILKPINENTPFYGNMVGLNCFGFGGANVHVIVRADSKWPSDWNNDIIGNIPRLVLMCGRSEEALNHIFNSITITPKMLSRDYLSLINDISKSSPFESENNSLKGMNFRGFAFLDKSVENNSIESKIIELKKVSENKPQIWYVLSGMGSQWPTMGRDIMEIEVCAQSIRQSAEVLKEFKIDLMNILLENNSNLIQCPINAFISLAAIQMALIDLLNHMDVTPDGIVGHSSGELICAYVDKCISAEEVIKMAYFRGKYAKEVTKTKGAMAAIGLSLEEVLLRKPENIFIGCHNSEDSVTVSGNEEAINEFVERLNSENVFARRVECSGIAFHSPLISDVRKPLKIEMKKIIANERMRSKKWISSTYDESNPDSRYVTADYFVEDLILPVLFADTLNRIPKNAVVIEISSHHLLQAILKRSLGSDMTYIPMMTKNGNNIEFILQSIGKLYTTGANPSIEKLYPSVPYPVSRGTPSISSLVEWNHNNTHKVFKYPEYFNPFTFTNTIIRIDLQDEKNSYLSGHCIDGRILFPATGSLLLVWKQFAQYLGCSYEELPVVFTNIKLIRATLLAKSGTTKFDIRISKSDGEFMILESGSVTVTGRICADEKTQNRYEYLLNDEMIEYFDENKKIILNTKDVYKELRLRGYEYMNEFQCITKAVVRKDCMNAVIKWSGNWVTFADSMLQTGILGRSGQGLYLPVGIDYIRCDPIALASEAQRSESSELLTLCDYNLSITVTKGLEFKGLKVNMTQRRTGPTAPLVESIRFVTYNDNNALERKDRVVLNEYMKLCKGQAFNILRKFKIDFKIKSKYESKINSIECEEILNNDCDDNRHEDYILLNILKEINSLENNSIDEKQRLELNEEILKLNKDILNQTISKEYFIRFQLDTVLENMNKGSINILEVSNSTGIIGQDVMKIINSTALNMKVNYHLLHSNVNELSKEFIDNIECHEFNVEKSVIPAEINEMDLIIYEEPFTYVCPNKASINLNEFLNSIWKTLKEKGFLILITKSRLTLAEEVLMKVMENTNDISFSELQSNRNNEILIETQKFGFSFMFCKFDGISKKALVFRKITTNNVLEKQTFIEITEDKCEQWIEILQNSLKTIDTRPECENIWLLAKDSPTNGLIGFVNCLRKEPNGERIRCVFGYDLSAEKNTNNSFDIKFLKSIIKKDLVMNVINSDKQLGSFRHFKIDIKKVRQYSEHSYLNVQTRGDISSFEWFESDHKYWPLGRKPNEMLCHVYYSALNFKDVMLATGKLTADSAPDDQAIQDCMLGLEFSGKDEKGNRVMGIVPNKGMATTVVLPDMDFVWSVPKHWTLEEASTVPIVYTTAYYALIIRGKLKPKETVLIHSGSGGVGQAAIAICLSLDCQLFITCGSDEKREFLLNEFPKLCDKNFYSSRDVSFEPMIMSATNGRGVDVVLNSLAEEKLQSSVRCLATNGRFLEIGKYDLSIDTQLDISKLLKNKTYHGIFLDTLIGNSSSNKSIIKTHKTLVRKLLEDGIKQGIVRPLKTSLFNCSQVEQAFRFMASGKHIGKVVLKIRDEESNSLTSALKYPSISRTVFKTNKSYIIIGGLGGFGLELGNWMIERGVKHLVLTSRSGVKDSYQKMKIKYFESLGINVVISSNDVSNVSECQELIALANSMGEGVGGIFNLALVLSDELFENQTAETFTKVLVPKSVVAHKLDDISRKLCSNLDYFVCFSSVACGRGNGCQTNYGFGNSVMERVCELRRAQGLHGLSIEWGAVGDVGYIADNFNTDGVFGGTLPQRMHSCLATLDHMLTTKWSVVSSFVKFDTNSKKNKNENIIKTIGHILGIENIVALDPKLRLVDLGMDSLMAVEVKQLLESERDLMLTVQDIRNMTIATILAINEKGQSNGDSNGKQNITFDVNDFLIKIPTEFCTRLNDVTEGRPVILVPPIEGTYNLLRDLVKNIQRPVIGINWTDACNECMTIEDTAQHFVDGINECLKLNENEYDLIGYSFGGCVAYEMALRLQTMNAIGGHDDRMRKVILMDTYPIQCSELVQRAYSEFEAKYGNDRDILPLLAMSKLYFPDELKSFVTIIDNVPIEERVAKYLHLFMKSLGVDFNENDWQFIARSLICKANMLHKYDVQGKMLDNDMMLIRADTSIISERDLPHNDYGFSNIISGKCSTHTVNGDHNSFIANNIAIVSELINEYLNVN